jgi:general secretion pathway protein G
MIGVRPHTPTMNIHRQSRGSDPNHFRAFTLIEVLVVVAILAILAAIVVPRIMDRPDEAKQVAARADVGAIVQALKLYRLDNGFYPSTDQGLAALVQRPGTNPVPGNWKQGGYLERLPKDPWGSDYQYLSPGVKGEIDVFSLGADRARGGEGSAADVGNWE